VALGAIINGGDGWGEHPTQILTDLYTVLKEKGTIDGLTWLAVGDMRMRTMHSLGYASASLIVPSLSSPRRYVDDSRI